MKKLLTAVAVSLLLFTSCGSDNANIKGDFYTSDYDGQKVYVQAIKDVIEGGLNIIDSTELKGGKFDFSVKYDKMPTVAFISLGKLEGGHQPIDSIATMGSFILEKGSIKIEMGTKEYKVEGPAKNKQFTELQDKAKGMNEFYRDVMQKNMGGAMSEDNLKAAQKEIEGMVEEMSTLSFSIAKDNIGNAFGQSIFLSSINGFKKPQVLELLEASPEAFKTNDKIAELKASIEKTVVDGDTYKDLTLEDKDGKSVQLADYMSNKKYILLDFWASWCKPCIDEIPHLKSAYTKYQDKGFDIVAVSVDQEKSDWEEALKTHKLDWTQLHDASMQAFENYGFETIPYSLLLDAEGKVVASNLRGEGLEKKLEELLGK